MFTPSFCQPKFLFSAQFTFIAGKEIEKTGDLSYDYTFAPNNSECAKLCVNNQGFTCNSYDFCSLDPSNICQLNRGHIEDGTTHLVNSTCDHFSREYRDVLKMTNIT